MDYDTLIDRVPTWMYAQNRDLVARMEEIVDQAHRQLFNIIVHEFFKTKITGLTIPITGELDLSGEDPAIMEIRGINVKYRKDDEWTPLFRRDYETLSMLYARNRPNRPRYYAESSGPLILQVYPTPNMVYDIEVTANQECPVMSPTVQNNILGDRAERALEKATMRQAALFMKDEAATATYEAEMTAAVNEINAAYARHLRDDAQERPRDTTNATGS